MQNTAQCKVLPFEAERQPVDEGQASEELDRLKAEIEAARRFILALGSLSECEQSPASEADIMDALDTALACVIDATTGKDGALLINDDATGDLVFALVHGDTPKEDLLWQRVPAGRGVVHWVKSNRRGTIVNNTLSDERFYRDLDEANNFCTRTIVAVPVQKDGELLGVIEVLNKRNGRYFSLKDQNHLKLLAYLTARLLVKLRNGQVG